MTKIHLNNFKAIWSEVKESFVDSSMRVGSSGWYILGDEVHQFESALVNHFPGVKYAIGCGNGLDALEIALKSLNLKIGDLVLTTPLSAFATTIAILRAGGIPVFIDVDQSGLIDLALVEEFLKHNKHAKFLLPVHLYGHAINLEQLKRLKNQYKLMIVEDCAQAIGACFKRIGVGTVGQVSATSFYPTKNLGCFGDGGALLTSSTKLRNLTYSLRNYGQVKKYQHSYVGLNSRLDEMQAAIMSSCFLPRLSDWTKRRREVAESFMQNMKNPLLNILPKPKYSHSVWHLFVLLVKKGRRQFMNYLAENGVESLIHYPILIPEQLAMKNVPHFVPNKLRVAKSIVRSAVSIPVNPQLSAREVKLIIDLCNQWQA